MPIPKNPMFDVRYDWDTGTWMVIVNAQPEAQFRRVGYELEEDAEEAKADLMRRLSAAPGGDVLSVLVIWEKGG